LRQYEGTTIIATATILLIRHAAHGHLGDVLSGRQEGIPLAPEGVRQAAALARRLSAAPPDAVQASPVQRAQETAQAIAAECGREVETVAALDEIDFGEWTGRRFAELDGDPAWSRWNTARAEAEAPGGESMAAAQERAMAHLRGAAERHAGGTVAMVTHCDIIRAIVAAVLGLSLDRILRFDVSPATISRIAAGEWGERLMTLNEGAA
jgi:probable phosphoglycerate mutase